MTPNFFDVLAVITLSMLVGMCIGIGIFKWGMNYLMSRGTLDVYLRGTRLEQFRMW
jgi:hypothetical protein